MTENALDQGVGLVTLGEDFFKAAHHLFLEQRKENIRFRHDGPIHYLYSHAIELLLKGGFLMVDPQGADIEKFQHDIHLMFVEAEKNHDLAPLVLAANRSVRDGWKRKLREARDTCASALTELGLETPEVQSRFGILSNEEIGSSLPELKDAVHWLSERHRYKGGLFRYFESRIDSKPVVTNWGLNEDVILFSADVGIASLVNGMRALIVEKWKN